MTPVLTQFHGYSSLIPQCAQTQGVVPFGQPLALFIHHQCAMKKFRRRQFQRAVKQQLPRRAHQQIRASHDLGDLHHRVVHDAGQLIRRNFIPVPPGPDHKVAEILARHKCLRAEMPVPERNRFAIGNTEAPGEVGGRVGALRRPDAAARRPYHAAFTLAEVLAAMLFLAIVIPAAVEALHVASLAGEVAARKGAAARIADRILNESLVMTNWNNGLQNGTVTEGTLDFNWTLTAQDWPQDAMQLLTAEVKFQAQGKDYSVKLSTLASLPNQPLNTMGLQQ